MISIRALAGAALLAWLLAPAIVQAQSEEDLNRVFREADGNADGDLSAAELAGALEASPDSARVTLMIVILDADGSQSLSLSEFQHIGALLSGQMTADQLARFFAFFDGNRDGVLDKAEFNAAVALLGGYENQAAIDEDFDAADQNGDERLDVKEFETLMN